ncbi:hypothetical protein [Flavobacterium sp. HSC-61S13]|uniref:hypothetical protein n=1 Tax=Flavobacterium sp. HSC-61S13 TaxID=2910963 RepID=UPI0020A13788|nr:hypothetical protein [Flavobacterium sp. HSC-61S13]MCP1994990.1 hypothetical protein [Flavobacterium sp. HSC-61S13]
MYKTVSVVFLFILTVSCGKSEDKWLPSRSVVFDIGFVNQGKFSGILYDSESKENLFYFADPISDRIIKFYDNRGNLNDSVSLVAAVAEIQVVDGISVISKDSIVLLNKRANQLQVLDRGGNTWYRLDLNQFSFDTGAIYHFSSSISGNFVLEGNSLLLHPIWYGNPQDIKENKVPREGYESAKYYYTHFVHSPHLIKIEDVFSPSPKAIYGLDDFYWNMENKVAAYIDGCFSTYKKGKVFVFSCFSPNLFCVNPINLQIIEEIRIVEDAQAVALPAPLAQTIDSDVLNFELQHKSIVGDFGYSSKNKKYILIQTIDISKNKEKDYRPFKVSVLDEKFKIEKVVVFDEGKYLWYSSFIADDGVYILKKVEDEKSNFGIKKYDFFEL